MLEAQDFASPTIEQFELEEIEEFCQGSGYEYKLVPEGTLAVPPETNLKQTDWQPEGSSQPSPGETAANEPSELSDAELDQIRRRLEGLL
jgi:hypothetical protein